MTAPRVVPAPAGATATVVPAATAAEPGPPMLGRHAVLLTLAAIGIGAMGSVVSWLLGRDQSLEPEAYIRYSIVITVAVYALVAALVLTRLAPAVRLRWLRGAPARAVLIGAVVGGGLSAALLAAVSQHAGHLAPDDRAVILMSEGDVAHIAVTFLLMCACAPLVEEVLFRGLLLESLRRWRTPVAVVGSGVAFAVWHLNPSALRYYALMGALLGVLYVRRGLVCSIAAHAAFNGVLTVAALAVVLAPARTLSVGDVTLEVPGGGWSVSHQRDANVQLTGPSGATLVLIQLPTSVAPSASSVIDRVRGGLLAEMMPGVDVDAGSTRRVRLPIGDAVEVDLEAGGHRGTMVLVPRAGQSLDMVFLSGGSMKAQADFERLLQSIRVT